MKKLTHLFGYIFVILTLMTFTASADTGNVKVQIAPFYTEAERVSVYNPDVEYPFIFYKNITYLPLTKGVCDRLGIVTSFDAQKGFYVVSDCYVPYIEDDRSIFGEKAKNYYGVKYDAVVPSYPIYLNGIRIDSSKEEYPFLNFRGITYLPLTYRLAVEELDLDLKWSQKEQSVIVRNRQNYGLVDELSGVTWQAYLGKTVENGVLIRKESNAFTEYKDEFDQTKRYPYSWYDTYLFNTNSQTLERLEHSYSYESNIFEFEEYREKPVTDKVSASGKALCYDGKEFYTFDSDITYVYSYEYSLSQGRSVIVANVSFGNAPAPYTSQATYLFLKTSDGIRHLQEYNGLCHFSDLYPDGKGGAYICTNGYKPMGSSRWSTPFSSVYYLDETGNLSDLTDNYPDINSLCAVGFYDGKLYVKAMCYGIDKAQYRDPVPFNTVNSGYCVIDTNMENKLTKLYPYISGEAFVSNGNLYCLTSYAYKPRIVNLTSGVIYEIE